MLETYACVIALTNVPEVIGIRFDCRIVLIIDIFCSILAEWAFFFGQIASLFFVRVSHKRGLKI